MAARRRFLRTSPSLSESGGLLAQGATTVTDDPIFVLAAGWRTGSTLLQRMIIEAGALVWGEPYSQAGPSQAMASVLGRALSTSTSSLNFTTTGGLAFARSPASWGSPRGRCQRALRA